MKSSNATADDDEDDDSFVMPGRDTWSSKTESRRCQFRECWVLLLLLSCLLLDASHHHAAGLLLLCNNTTGGFLHRMEEKTMNALCSSSSNSNSRSRVRPPTIFGCAGSIKLICDQRTKNDNHYRLLDTNF